MTPIVLHHGLFGFGDIKIGPLKLSYFTGIDRAITDRGHPLIVSRVHPTGSIERRARELKVTIRRQLKSLDREKQKVVIIAHSMGGLDARYMISKLGMDDRVAALVTITTPHRGSPYADWCLKNLGQRLGGLQLMNLLGWDVRAVSDLTTASCARFNEEIPDAPAVKYFSISAARPWHRVPPFAVHAHKIITDAEGPNDALVSVKSSTWAEHLGTWPADHWHTINHRMVVELKEPTGDITPYYVKVLNRLREDNIFSLTSRDGSPCDASS
ncbi:MAG: alpha/beta fold hydrolase [Tepidisphaeraceae bacterium]